MSKFKKGMVLEKSMRISKMDMKYLPSFLKPSSFFFFKSTPYQSLTLKENQSLKLIEEYLNRCLFMLGNIHYARFMRKRENK